MSYIILCVYVYVHVCVCMCNVVIMKILEQKNIRQKNDEFLIPRFLLKFRNILQNLVI